MSDNAQTTHSEEVYRPAWPSSKTNVSYGLRFPEACARHVSGTFNASKIYIIASGSLSRNTNHVKRLQEALGSKVVGTRCGMQPHSLWSEILEVTKDASEMGADLLITLGAGSLTDAAKIVSLVSGPTQTFTSKRLMIVQGYGQRCEDI
jgi:alcohol dehydrogenase class IV